MAVFNRVVTRFFDILLAPFAGLNPWWGLAAVSAATGVVMLFIFKATSNQRALRDAKDQVVGHLLEIRLYQHDLAGVLRAQARALAKTGRYLRYAVVPIVWLLVPVVIILAQTDLRYGRRPLHPGETAIIGLRFADTAPEGSWEAQLTAPPGVVVESESLRIFNPSGVDWRVRAQRPGAYRLTLAWGETSLTKQVVVSRQRVRVSPRRVAGGPLGALLNPGEPPLPPAHGVREIACSYPPAGVPLLGRQVHWLVAFFALSLAAAYALKGVFRVEV